MGQIKSALELALEKTKDIKGDKEGLEIKAYRENGMKLVSKAEQANDDLDIAAELAKFNGKQLDWVKEGMNQILSGLLSLPASKDILDRFKKLKYIFPALSKKPEIMVGYIEELTEFFAQYLTQKEQLILAVQKQLEPNIRQKEDAMYQQTGRRVRITIESDPEFSKFLTMNMDKLQQQYDQALAKVREEILEQL